MVKVRIIRSSGGDAFVLHEYPGAIEFHVFRANELPGRGMSIYRIAFRGGSPLGSLVAGYLASAFTAPVVIGVEGVLLVCVAAYFLIWRKSIKQP